MSKKKTTKQFIEEAKLVHGNKYDYSKSEYVNATTKVIIICPQHGEFLQRLCDHLNGRGCKTCFYEENGKQSRLDFKSFLEKVKSVHGDRYAYNKDTYKGADSNVEISCPIHGVFIQKGFNHINGKGCPKCGQIKRRKPVKEHGINDFDGSAKKEYSYRLWVNLLGRTVDPTKTKILPTYANVTICDEWLSYSKFKEWFDNPANGYKEGYSLDKDILVKGNKIYSPETCCFVPQDVNVLFTKRTKSRGEYPIGVNLGTNGKYCASLRLNKERKYLGYFDSPEEAFYAYKEAKEAHLKHVAETLFKEEKITKKVYDALISYKVEISD